MINIIKTVKQHGVQSPVFVDAAKDMVNCVAAPPALDFDLLPRFVLDAECAATIESAQGDSFWKNMSRRALAKYKIVDTADVVKAQRHHIVNKIVMLQESCKMGDLNRALLNTFDADKSEIDPSLMNEAFGHAYIVGVIISMFPIQRLWYGYT